MAECPQPCGDLSQDDSREGKTCPQHPCTCQVGLEIECPTCGMTYELQAGETEEGLQRIHDAVYHGGRGR